MSEQFERHGPGTAEDPSEAGERSPSGQDSPHDAVDDGGATGSTGNQAVDDVLRTMQGLQDRPVEEHVAVFEAAHEKLRAALADAADRPSGPPAG